MKEKFRLDPKTGEFIPVLTDDGAEIPDPTPMAPPVGFIRHTPLHERIRAMVQHEYQRARENDDVETPEEADDFLVPDEEDARYGEKFAMMPGHEHDWEENYEPPKDFKDMKQRLIDAGWKPPEKDQENSAVKPAKSDEKSNSLEPSQAEVKSKGPAAPA